MTDDHRRTVPAWPAPHVAKSLVLLIITGVFVILSFMLVLPFFPGVTWAAALAIAAYPLHRAIEKRIGRPSASAGLSVIIVACVIVAPTVLIVQNAIGEGQAVTGKISGWVAQTQQDTASEDSDPQLRRVMDFAGKYVDVKSTVQRLSGGIASYIPTVVAGTGFFVAQILIAFFVLFFLLRDRKEFLNKIKSLLPLTQSEADKLFHRVHETVHATIYGTFGVSLIQGILGGLMFWWLGLPAPALWGAVMFILSLVPILGAPVVWLPVAIFLAATGQPGKALILSAWGFIVIGSIDNILYPIFVGDRVRMHTLAVFISAVGGIALIGASGLVLGPVIVVAADALIEFWKARFDTVEENEGSARA